MSVAVISRFASVLRAAEVPVSPAETLDAVAVTELLGFDDRQALKQGLALVMAKSRHHEQVFGDCFDAFFHLQSVASSTAVADQKDTANRFSPAQLVNALIDRWRQPSAPQTLAPMSPLGQQLLAADNASLDRQMMQAASAVALDQMRVVTQKGLYGRRLYQAMGGAALDQEILALSTAADSDSEPLADALRVARQQLREGLRQYVADQFVLTARAHGRQLRERTIREASLRHLTQFREVRGLVEKMARRLANRHARRQRRARRGTLDGRRTLVAAMRHGGVPAALHWRRRRLQKTRLLVICDVSSSVSAAARFLLLFLSAISDVLPTMRSFVFASRFAEVSDVFRHFPAEQAIDVILEQHAGSGTDYGAMLGDFLALCEAQLDQRTTVIILGDARNNDLPAEQHLLAHIGDRCRSVYWLNPEARSRWGSGDSVMLQYQPYCRDALVCANLDGLERFVDRLLLSLRSG